jgi:hypothetical protein
MPGPPHFRPLHQCSWERSYTWVGLAEPVCTGFVCITRARPGHGRGAHLHKRSGLASARSRNRLEQWYDPTNREPLRRRLPHTAPLACQLIPSAPLSTPTPSPVERCHRASTR